MRPEDHEGTGGDGLPVPMAWMYSEYLADRMLASGDLMEPATLEYRAGRDALALTVFLSDGAAADGLPVARVDELRLLTAYGGSWRRWVCARLEAWERPAAPAGLPDPDLALARAAWRWLEETEFLAADLDAITAPWDAPDGRDEEGEVRVWTPAWQLGLPLGHMAVHLC
ncbi:hypothetical protein ABZ172_02925 [Streptomyces sp. NPDC006296]|uniref:hypothetical protein n=1 Tax=Streptomyces sp. NPDC006296 TaxID=3156746 RepID=UPI0033A69F3F